MQIIVQCECGQRMRAPKTTQSAVGRCVRCGRPIKVSEENTISLGKPGPKGSMKELREPTRSESRWILPGEEFVFPSDTGQAPSSVPPIPSMPFAKPAANPWAEEDPARGHGTNREDTIPKEIGERVSELQTLWGDAGDQPGAAQLPSGAEAAFVPEKKPVAEDQCARCGRPFRGDWDRHEDEEGTLCTFCSRQVDRLTPSYLDVPTGVIRPPSREELREMTALAAENKKPERDPDKYRGLMPFLITFAVVMLLIMVLPVERWINGFTTGWHEKPKPTETAGVVHVFNSIAGYLFLIVGYMLPTYLAFLESGRNVKGREFFWSNLGDTAKYAFVFFLFGVTFQVPVTAFFYGPIAITGVFFSVFLTSIIVWALSELNGRDIFNLYLFNTLLAPVFWMLRYLITGTLALAFL